MIDREVVQQNDVGVRGQRFIELFERIDFHFDLHEVTGVGARGFDGRTDAAGNRDVVVFDEDRIV